MPLSRSAGVLLHVTSLPGPFGIGDLGSEAFAFVDFLARTRQTVWQVLPIGPTGWGNSPYQSPSAFAGNPLLIDLRQLQSDGLLEASELEGWTAAPGSKVDYMAAAEFRRPRLWRAFERFNGRRALAARRGFPEFCDRNDWWLDEDALFTAIKESSGGREWTAWEPDIVRRKKSGLDRLSRKLGRQVAFRKFLQFEFFTQWERLRAYANASGIRIFGDVPIFVAHDSADVWANQELFSLDEAGRPTVVAGVPPDYFSKTGQRWGNPLYRWDVLEKTGHAWWIRRLKASFELYDLVRIDHFRGFESHWEVPATESTAIRGQWRRGPGAAFFRAVQQQLGSLALVAEDLGMITPAVEALRDELGLPGMRVLQFAFGGEKGSDVHRPHNFPRQCVVYTGTHDNDTTVGWFRRTADPDSPQSAAQIERERRFALKFLGSDGREIHWDFIRLAMSSVAALAMIPMQDLLGLGSEARMNTPGTGVDNWAWKLLPEPVGLDVEDRLAELTELFGRGGDWSRTAAVGPERNQALAEK